MDTVTCPNCGQRIGKDELYCPFCDYACPNCGQRSGKDELYCPFCDYDFVRWYDEADGYSPELDELTDEEFDRYLEDEEDVSP